MYYRNIEIYARHPKATVTVKASTEYNVIIEEGLLGKIGSLARELLPGKVAALITEERVNVLYGDRVENSLQDAGFTVFRLVLPAGEETKCLARLGEVLEFLASCKLTRTDAVFALGGGVIGDLAGFASAVYLRGIRYVQIPTTLLAAVDSSVGGKTAIDLEGGKNLAGAFHQPAAVYCDPLVLKTLSPQVFSDGCAEVIKYAVLKGEPLLSLLADPGNADWTEIITRCVSIKRDMVEEDEFDNGVRMLLNLGHTVGHAIEKESHFSVSHGSAIAMGMVIAARISEKLRVCQVGLSDQIASLLKQYGLPTVSPYPREILLDTLLSDKKRAGDTLRLILPREMGDCILYPAKVEELPTLLEGI